MLSRNLLRCALKGSPRKAQVLSQQDVVLYTTFARDVFRGDYTNAPNEVWTHLAQEYKKYRSLNATAFRHVMSVALTKVSSISLFVPKLVEYLSMKVGHPFIMPKRLVMVCLQEGLRGVRKAKNVDVTCYAGSATHKKLNDMLRLFNFFRHNGHEVDRKAWTSMLQGAAAARFATLTRLLVREMLEDKVVPDAFILGIALYSFKCTKFAKEDVVTQLRRDTLSLWAEFLRMGVVPDGICYAALISVLVSFGDIVHAEQVMAEMKQKGFTPCVRVYTGIIAGVTTEAKLHAYIRDMAETGVKLDGPAFASVLLAVSHIYSADPEAMVEKAEGIFDTLLSEHVNVDEFLCTSLLLVYRQARQVQRSSSFLAKMIKTLKIVPTQNSLNFVLETGVLCATKEGDLGYRTAEWVWKYCKLHREFSHHTFGFMMRMYLQVHKPESVISTFSALKAAQGTPITLVHFELLRDAYIMKGEPGAADAIARLPLFTQLSNQKEKSKMKKEGDHGGAFQSMFREVCLFFCFCFVFFLL